MTIGVDIDCAMPEPSPDTIHGLRHLMRLDSVVIHTSQDPAQAAHWLRDHGFDTTTDERCSHCNRGSASYRNPACTYCGGTGLLTAWWPRGQLLVTNRKIAPAAQLTDLAPKGAAS